MRKTWPWVVLSSVTIAAASGVWAAQDDAAGSAKQSDRPQAQEPREDARPNSGPSPRDAPAPGLRLDDRMNRPHTQPGENGEGKGAQQAPGNDKGDNALPPSDRRPENPANPATPLFPANPHPPADPGQPGNPVTPASLHFA